VNALELFCGAGLASLGLRAAGINDWLGIDSNSAAADIRRALGFKTLTAQVDPVALARFRGQVELLWGSPSCQPWSTAQTRGERGACDVERNLWPTTVETVEIVRPTWCIFENVGGSVSYAQRTVLPQLRARYPEVSAQVLDAQFYGAPQTRRRLFVVAGPRPFRWPAPTTPRPRTLGEALPWLRHRDDPGNADHVYHVEGRGGTEPRRLDMPAPTVTTMEEKGTRASESSGWTFHGGPDRASDAAFLATGRRRITWQEAAILQTVPASATNAMSMLLAQRKTTVHALYQAIGNGVACSMAEALGRALLAS